jgi:NADPH:quinone reductase-like Zn-dependent oxidoreductase
VLVNGAAGSVGTAAVQLARLRGAEVTAVCSGHNAELVHSLGASVVIDYTQADYATGATRYDIVFDAIGKSSYARARNVLRPGGRYLSPVLNLSILVNMLTTRWFGDRRALITFTGLRPNADKAADLLELGQLAEAGDYLPVIDRSWPVSQIVEAHRYVESGHKRGNVVLDVGNFADG